MKAAIFLDRDGTLVETRHYPSRPEDLVLYAGLGAELQTLQRAGFLLVLITNQSGLARGYFGWAELDRMHEKLLETLRLHGVAIDGIYVCPHHPEGTIGELAIECDCRKPKPGMLLRAARELDINLTRSWFIGDILDDVEAGNRAGCRTVLVDLGTERVPESPLRTPTYVARDSLHALRLVQAMEGIPSHVDLDYRPSRWGSGAPLPALSV
jgi:D-glycero-D-manno-heptose 1,7-bisphosphate phosphatase